MKTVDMRTWDRRDIYEFFLPMSDPFYSTSFLLDVTKLYAYKKAHGVSFYYALCRLCAKAMNGIENFRYTSRNGEIFLHDKRIPSFTDRHSGSELFYYVTPPLLDDLDAYCKNAKAISAAQTVFIDTTLETDALIYLSAIPELAVTAQTVPHNFNDPSETENNVPRVCWGKYTQRSGRLTLTVTVEVNHRFVDGLHVARFANELQRLINELEP